MFVFAEDPFLTMTIPLPTTIFQDGHPTHVRKKSQLTHLGRYSLSDQLINQRERL